MHPLFDIVFEALKIDVSQMVEEGHDEKRLLEEVEKAKATGSLDTLIKLEEDFWDRPSPPDFPYEEPNDWDGICIFFPDPESHKKFKGAEKGLADRILAAWLGRCIGCQLGKPMEGGTPEEVKDALQLVGSWPLLNYMNPAPDDVLEGLPKKHIIRRRETNRLAKGNFDAVTPDDDIHYALVSQITLEENGPEFTTEQAIGKLIELTPVSCLYASGRNMFRTALFGIPSPYTGLFGNAFRQSLGAQIRCDAWGWAAPANPALAAKMAYKDAIGSQRRNGVYSALFFAVLMADAFAQGNALKAIDTAEKYVPPKSKFAEMIRLVKSECEKQDDWEKVNAVIDKKYKGLARNHSLPNGAITLMALLKGEGDFSKTIGLSVMAGRDTDCNGATAGSIMGCTLGTKGIPKHWIEPLNDTIRSQLKNIPEVKISEIANRMFEVAKKNARFESRMGEGLR